jgi:hypothetical protein
VRVRNGHPVLAGSVTEVLIIRRIAAQPTIDGLATIDILAENRQSASLT